VETEVVKLAPAKVDRKISRQEAANRLGVSYRTILRLEKTGKLRSFQNETGSINRVSAADVDGILKPRHVTHSNTP
jgi:excisionase family DNA binding protein